MSVDSGATAHAFTKEGTGINDVNDLLVHTNLPFTNISKSKQRMKVMYPDGNIDEATHEAILTLPNLPISARKVHLFGHLASGSLISLGQLCDAGCTAYFDKNKVYIFFNGKIIMQGSRNESTNRLWQVDNMTTSTPPVHSLNSIIDNPTIAERIQFYHASLFSPTLDTLAKAITAGYLTTFPHFTVKQLRRYPPRSEATVQGHMRAQQKGLKKVVVPSPRVNNITTNIPSAPAFISQEEVEIAPPCITQTQESDTNLAPSAQPSPTIPSSHHKSIPATEETAAPTLRTNHVYPACLPISGQIYSDQSGKFLITSASGNNYVFLLYDFDSNLIWAVPIPTRSKFQILKAYQQITKLLSSRGLNPKLQRIDNECSDVLKEYMTANNITYQLTPKGKHARNAAEKGIQTWKDHFLAGAASTNPEFPLNRWDRLVEQANITLNLMRPSRINPRLSSYAQIFGAFDYNKTPLPPPGMKVLAHVLPEDRRSFDPHAIKGFSIGPATEHYR